MAQMNRQPHTGLMEGRSVGGASAVNVSLTLLLAGLALWLTACGTEASSQADPVAAPVTLDPSIGEVFTPSTSPVDQAVYLTAEAAYASAFPQHPQMPSDVVVAFGHFTMMLGPTGSPNHTYKAKGVATWGFSQPGCLPEGGNLPGRLGHSPSVSDSPSEEPSSQSTHICMLWSIVDASNGHLIDMTNQQVP